MLIQIFWIFFCLPVVLHIDIGNLASAIIALSLYMGAISGETFRAAMKAIAGPARCMRGTRPWPTHKTTYIIFPQTILHAIPTLLSTRSAYSRKARWSPTVGMSDLLYVGQNITTRSTSRDPYNGRVHLLRDRLPIDPGSDRRRATAAAEDRGVSRSVKVVAS